MTASLSKVTDSELDQLADDIRRHHKAVERHAQKMVAEAVAAGELLIEAKDQAAHGEFGPFLTRCGVNPRSARVYMRLARNSGSAAVLEAKSIRAALEALAGPSRTPAKRLDLGPLCPPSHAGDRRWQTQQWLLAMAAKGRGDLPQLRRHLDHRGRPKDPLTHEQARHRWKRPYRCPVCEGWHGGRYLKETVA